MTNAHIDAFIDAAPVSRFQWQAIGVCLAIGLLDGLDIQLLGVAAPALIREWGLKPEVMGPVFMAAPAGMILGALSFGPLADRFGRRRLIIFGTLAFGLLTLLTGHAQSLQELKILRFLAGIGLGGVLPNLIALVNEYSPQRLRGTITAVAFCGLPLGSLFGGLLASWIIPIWGWPTLFYAGGAVPALVALLAIVMLPESIRYLLLDPANRTRVEQLLRRISPHARPLDPPAAPVARIQSSALDVFGPGRTPTTLLLALSAGMNMFMLYFFINWTPTLMHAAGMSPAEALWASACVNTGGTLGALSWGVLMDRFGTFRVMSVVGLSAAAAIVLVGVGNDSRLLLLGALFVTGFCVLGAQIGNYALIGSVYPTQLRSTGVGTVLGIGRIGSVLGPLAGGWMLHSGWPIPLIFAVVAVPGVLSAAGIWLTGRLPRRFD
jgi:AAHS family 4-hydroxybenzoate transporter-like MFS transporter